MHSGAPPPPRDNHPRTSQVLTDAYLGLLAFGVLNLLVLLFINMLGVRLAFAIGWNLDWMVMHAAILLFTVGVLATWAYVRAGRQGLATGLVGGYALITAVSGGECTGWGLQRPTSTFNGATGLYAYLAAVVIFTLALIIVNDSSTAAEGKTDDE